MVFEIAGGIVIAYIVIRFRRYLTALILAPVLILFGFALTWAEAKRFRKPPRDSAEYLDWANRRGAYADDPDAYESPPMPSRESPEYLDWANREGRWSTREK